MCRPAASSADISVNVQQQAATIHDTEASLHTGDLNLEALRHFGCMRATGKTH